MRFLMESNARAKRAARELQDILEAQGRRDNLKACRGAIAGMYGYASWSEMQSCIGMGRSPEDAEVPFGQRQARHAMQRAALIRLGLDATEAEAIRHRLSVTGRSEPDVEAMLVHEVMRPFAYHPWRIEQAVWHLAKTCFELGVEGRRSWNSPAWNGPDDVPYAAMAHAVATAAAKGGETPLDVSSFDAEWLDHLHNDAWYALHKSRRIIDASCARDDLAKHDVTDATYAGGMSTTYPIYVHFGTSAFPSPYPGCGIEGCYLRIEDDGAMGPMQIATTFVVSPEIPPGSDHYDLSHLPEREVLLNCRIVACLLEAEGDGPLRIGDVIDIEDNFMHGDAALWRPYLAAPLAVAWNALTKERADVDVQEGLVFDFSEDANFIRRWQRARTPAKRDALLKEMSTAANGFLVRFLGGVPEDALTDDDFFRDYSHLPFPELDDPLCWAEAYSRMGLDHEVSSAKLYYAELALRLSDSSVPAGSRTILRALCVKSDALCMDGKLLQAAEALDAAASHAKDLDLVRILMRQVSLRVMMLDEEGARRGIERLEENSNPQGGLLAWAHALVETSFRRFSLGPVALRTAADRLPYVAELMSSGDNRRSTRWEPETLKPQHGVEALVVALQHDAWNAMVPGYRQLLQQVAGGR